MTAIVAMITCHNRRLKTLTCLRALLDSDLPSGVRLDVILVDDGSTDGTAQAVAQSYPQVTVLEGNGSLFWNRGMHLAQETAIKTEPDFLLWLNDDTILKPQAVDHLLSVCWCLTRKNGLGAVVVGTTVDPATGCLTYGGLKSKSLRRRFNYARIPFNEVAQECEAMNGNIVLVPKGVYERVGAVDPVFEHALGDIDYALRVRGAGFGLFIAPGYQGYCSANSASGTHRDNTLGLRNRWSMFSGRKGLPVTSWRHFVRRHGGWAWPLYFAWPYINFALGLTRKQLQQLRR